MGSNSIIPVERTVEIFWSLELEKPFCVQSLMRCYLGAWKIRMFLAMKTIIIACEIIKESIDYTRAIHVIFWIKNLWRLNLYWDNGWLVENEKSA